MHTQSLGLTAVQDSGRLVLSASGDFLFDLTALDYTGQTR